MKALLSTAVIAATLALAAPDSADAQNIYYRPGYGDPATANVWNQSTFTGQGVYTFPGYAVGPSGYYFGYNTPYNYNPYFGVPNYGYGNVYGNPYGYGYQRGYGYSVYRDSNAYRSSVNSNSNSDYGTFWGW